MLSSKYAIAIVAAATFSFTAQVHSALVTTGLQLHLDADAPGATPVTTWEALVGGNAALANYGSGSAPAYVSTGIVNHYNFPRVNDTNGGYMQVAVNPLGTDANIEDGFTIESWVRLNSSGTNIIQVAGGFDRTNQTSTSFRQVGLRFNHDSNTTGEYRSYRANADGSSFEFASFPIIDNQQLLSAPGSWDHVVLTFDGSKYQGYKNGQLLLEPADTLTVDSIDEFLIGAKRTTSAGLHQFLRGDVSQLRVYDAPLTAAEINQNYRVGYIDGVNEGYVRDGLAVHLDARYTGNTAANWVNLVEGGSDATMSATSLTAPGGGPAYYSFDGSTSNGIIGSNPLGTMGNIENGFSLEVWLRPEDNTNYSALAGFDRSGNASDQIGVRIGDDSPVTNTYDYYLYRGQSGSFIREKIVDEDPAIPLDEWAQIVMTWDGSELIGYKNGVEALTVTGIDFDDVAGINQFLLGAKTTGTGDLHQWFDGDLSIVRLYDASLTSDQVWTNWASNYEQFGLRIPEPSTFAMLLAAALLVLGVRWR